MNVTMPLSTVMDALNERDDALQERDDVLRERDDARDEITVSVETAVPFIDSSWL